MKFCNINPRFTQTQIVKTGTTEIKNKLWEVIDHPVEFVDTKEEVLKKCPLRSCKIDDGRYAYSLGLPVFGTIYYSLWYTL